MSMRVITQDSFGGPEVLRVEDRPTPEPLPTEIRVRVEAAGINPVDWKTRAGGGVAGLLGQPPFVLGWDVAGVVDAVGFGVTRFAVGDRVFGMPWFPRAGGAYADYVTAPSRQFASAPTTASAVEAGALPLAVLTAWQALVDTADVQPGHRVLIHAAAGGVGHLAVQIANSRGAYVVGTASASKHATLAALGADELVDYRSTPFEEAVGDIDVVLDLVGGDTSLRSLPTMRPGGLLVAVPSGVRPDLVAAAEEARIRATGILVEPDGAALERVAALVDTGSLRVLVEETFALEDAGKAQEVGEHGRTTGKLVLTTS